MVYSNNENDCMHNPSIMKIIFTFFWQILFTYLTQIPYPNCLQKNISTNIPHLNQVTPKYDTIILRGNTIHVAISQVYKHHHDLLSLARRLSFLSKNLITHSHRKPKIIFSSNQKPTVTKIKRYSFFLVQRFAYNLHKQKKSHTFFFVS
jgi:hypothetical protein